MRLRRLESKDAPLMLEWMHDPSVVEYMNADFASMKAEDCEAFIQSAKDTTRDLHMAIVDENDTYMGTVSLKNIDGKTAEFAITVRKEAMGKGFSKYGMREIIRIAFEELGLEKVYWCVNHENKRAIRFYDKNGYDRVPAASLKIGGGVQQRTNIKLCLVPDIQRKSYVLQVADFRKRKHILTFYLQSYMGLFSLLKIMSAGIKYREGEKICQNIR